MNIEFLTEMFVERMLDEYKIDKERYELLCKAVVVDMIKRIKDKEEFKSDKGICSEDFAKSIATVTTSPELRDSIKMSEIKVIVLSIPLMVIDLIDRLHDHNPEHICENCPADYVCNPDPEKKKKIE